MKLFIVIVPFICITPLFHCQDVLEANTSRWPSVHPPNRHQNKKNKKNKKNLYINLFKCYKNTLKERGIAKNNSELESVALTFMALAFQALQAWKPGYWEYCFVKIS